MRMKKVILLVMDSVGVGALPDAVEFGDVGSNTLANTAAVVGGLTLPNLQQLGLGNIVDVAGIKRVNSARPPLACFGKMAEKSPGKDTVTGHWELAGLISDASFAHYEQGFPKEVIEAFEMQTGFQTMHNSAASGTVIIDQLGKEHMETGQLIVYTSADSVFQIAAHEQVVPLDTLYRLCRTARSILDPYRVARVIARPFVGTPGNFVRTYNRRDFCMEPPAPTLLDYLVEAGIPVTGIGKIGDVFAGRGITESVHTEGNRDGLAKTLEVNRGSREGFIFVNLVDFDTVYGHRRNPEGYARALEEADGPLGQLVRELGPDTALIITGDHGCDPTHRTHTDHTREYVPVLFRTERLPMGLDLGIRESFSDVAATVAKLFGCSFEMPGTPFFSDSQP